MLEELAQRELTRKQFILLIISLAVGIIGLQRLLNTENSETFPKIAKKFSSGAYGR